MNITCSGNLQVSNNAARGKANAFRYARAEVA